MRSTERALAQVPFLAPLSATERRRIADHADLATFPAGTTIVARGDPGRTLYVILKGRVRVLHSAKAGDAVPLAEFGPGEFFGEMALLEDAPRSADVVAVSPTTCALLTWEVFQRDLLGNPGVATALLTALSRRLRALSELHERPQVETKAPPKERARRILREGEAAMVADIRGTLVVKEHNHFTLCDRDGNCPIGNRAGLGLYLGDTRHLSGYELSLGRVQPVVLVSSARLGYAAEQQLTNRDLTARGRTVRKETLLVSRERLAHDSGFYEEITVRNFNPFPVAIDLQLRFGADFADIFEVRGVSRDRRGAHRRPVIAGDTVTLIYDGLDGRRYQTALTFTPRPTRLGSTTMAHRAQVAAFDECVLRVRVTARVTAAEDQGDDDDGRMPEETPPAAAQMTRAHHSYEEWQAAATRVVTGSELFNATIDRSLADLRLLVNRLDDQPYFAAGIPWFAALFGRDSLITALLTLAWNPDLSAGTLRLLARYQGTRDDAWRDEEPGKILHELRTGELARTGRVPHTPYYGSIDATPLFLVLAAAYHDWTGDDALVRELLPHLEAALDWCHRWGDRDGDGYIEYARRSGLGLANQGWRDSGDGVLFQDGRLPDPPIALVEVQGYLYAAYRGMARLLRAIGDGNDGRASELDERAASLKERFNRDFWMPERGFYALGLDGRKGPIDAITSNPGQALWTDIVDEARAPAVAARLLSDDLFSGWGVRTLGRSAAAYNPLGYHLGTIWPHDNALIAAGLRRYGFAPEANRILAALYDAAQEFPDYRLPELFAGIARTSYGVPIGYPVACSPQAWAAATLPYLLTETLGLRPTGGGTVLDVVHPILPSWLGDVRVRGLRVGETRLELRFRQPETPDEPARVTVENQVGPAVEVRVVARQDQSASALP